MAELIGVRSVADFMGSGLSKVINLIKNENLPVIKLKNGTHKAKSQHIEKWQSDRKEGLKAVAKYLGVSNRQTETLKMHGDFEYYHRGKMIVAYTKSLDLLMRDHPERLRKHYKGRARDAK